MKTFGKGLIGCVIEVKKYQELAEAIPDKELEIIEVVEEVEREEVRVRYMPYLEGVRAFPAAVTLGDEMIFVGDGDDNGGCVYYVDIEFGVFKMNDSIEGFIAEVKS